VLTQTRRHSYLTHLLGIKRIVLAVNKMDLVNFSQATFEAIVADYRAFADGIGIRNVIAIPISSLAGDNIASVSKRTPWYAGPALITHLETVEIDDTGAQQRPFRMPVQWVNRPNLDFRGFAGLISQGRFKPGYIDRVLPSGRTSTVSRIVTLDADLEQAVAGQSVTVTLSDALDCSRGDVLAAAEESPEIADQFEATLVWMADEPLLPGRPYWLKLASQLVTATVHSPKYQINVNTMEHLAAKTLGLNAIGIANLSTDKPLIFEPYEKSRELGGFILIDKISNATVAAGMLHFALRRSSNVHWQPLDVDRSAHARLKHQHAQLLWFTGLSGSGKSSIANLVQKKLYALGKHSFLLDGDNIRHGLNKDLGFTDADRVENIRRIGEVAKLMTDAGLIVLTAFISPFRAERRMVREMSLPGEFIEIYVETPLEVAEQRDVKGLYKKARAGQLMHFTGIDSPYETPENPEIRVNTVETSAEQAAEEIVAFVMRRQAT
jgi:bifunctional enzyme CysN/CysC